MEIQLASTPFGSRRMTAALLSAQQYARRLEKNAVADKWQLHRWLCEAKSVYALSDRSLAILKALLSFHPDTVLDGKGGLIVFPSNRLLIERACGMADATLRRHLAALVDAGFIARQDSPNGKRYARRAKGGEVQIAFGFSLAPLLARADELEAAAEQVRMQKAALREARERLTLLRRDIAKLLELALAEGWSGDWNDLHQRFRIIVDSIPRRAEQAELAALVTSLETIRLSIDKLLNKNENIRISSGSESQNERQQTESKPESFIELTAPASTGKRMQTPDPAPQQATVSLDMVLRACPEIAAYAGSPIRQWPDLIETAAVIRRFLNIDGRLYELANRMLGKHDTAIAIAYLLQRHGEIRSAGGYLRVLTEKAAEGAFSIRPMMLAALRSHQAKESQEHFQQKCEAPPQGNQSTGLISDPASMRSEMRKNKEIERFRDSMKTGIAL